MAEKGRIRITFDVAFLILGWLVQIITFILAPTHWLSLVSGLFGITSVILCSQGKISTFFFGFAQIITYTGLCWMERFYAGIAMNVFYFASQIYGIFSWRRNMQGAETIQPRHLSRLSLFTLIAAIVFLSSLVGLILARYTDDTQPYLDALTTVPAIAAQILMVLVYREQWYFWLAIDVLYVIMWIAAGNWSMAAQYAFWCANCIYGLRKWRTTIVAG